MKLDLFVKLKYQSSTIIKSVGIEYYARDLLRGVNNYRMVQKRIPSFIFG